ncbi:MAG: ornithine--oxo-acid transaminase [Proteobacteria bacterium]|nr:ornithine--oxo-acid transaminase [Pseudomonadota bacterium]
MTLQTHLTTADYIALEAQHNANNYHPLDIVIARASGVWMWDVEGNRYFDFLSSYSAVNQGHCHPRIIAAAKEQLDLVTLTSRAFRNDQLPLLAKELCELSGFDMMLPMNSGAEAVETAVKACRRWAYKVKGVPDGQAEIIVCDGNFHGRTTTAISFSTEAAYKDGFGPFTPGFRYVPYGDAAALRAAITPNTAAFMLEPIQGESGVVLPPAGFLEEADAICREHNVLLAFDEIQSGLGRSGKLFAFEHEGIRPDMVIVGKALSGGVLPVSAVLSSREVMALFVPGTHGSTFGGSPLAARVAREALKVLVEEGLIEHSAELGAYFIERMRAIRNPLIKEVRGRGLWAGLELKPEAGGARPYCEALKERGLLCKETRVHTIRFAPPLVVTREELDWALERIEAVLSA